MPRVFLLLTLLLLGLAGGAPLLSAGQDACEVSCADDDEDGPCAADCADCACCAHAPIPLLAQAVREARRIDVVETRPLGSPSYARAGVGQKIPHVPIRRAS